MTEKAGWIDCRLSFAGERRHLGVSDVFPPFYPLLDFLWVLHTQRLPHTFYWDEEGQDAHFEAWLVSDVSQLFRLRVHDDSSGPLFEKYLRNEYKLVPDRADSPIHAWLNDGWKVESIDQNRTWVKFQRA